MKQITMSRLQYLFDTDLVTCTRKINRVTSMIRRYGFGFARRYKAYPTFVIQPSNFQTDKKPSFQREQNDN